MSDLSRLVETLSGVSRDARRMASELAQKSVRLKQAAGHAAAVAASQRSHGGTQAAASLQSAAVAAEQAAQLLLRVASEGEAFVGRHQSGGGSTRSPLDPVSPSKGSLEDQVTRSEFIEAEFRTAAGSAFFYASDTDYRSAAGDVPPYPGEYTLDLHGTPDSVALGDSDGELRELSANQFADVVRSSTGWAGEPIRLFSCNTGADSDGFAQQLANELGVAVTAPTKPVWSTPGGSPFVTESGWVTIDGQNVWTAIWPPTGTWITFSPQR